MKKSAARWLGIFSTLRVQIQTCDYFCLWQKVARYRSTPFRSSARLENM
jgi:hypothetical protein